MRGVRSLVSGLALCLAAESPALASEHASATEASSPSKSDDRPTPIKTALDETEPAAPTSNPWADAGLANRRGSKGPEATDDVVRPASAAVLAGYASENFRLGFGVRGGYSLFGRLYLGASFVYHFGPPSVGGLSMSMFYPSAELGYDAHIGLLTIRPYVGAGLLVLHASLGRTSASNEYFGLYPGLQVDFAVPDTPGFVGVDGRVFLLPTEENSKPSIGVFLVAGARL